MPSPHAPSSVHLTFPEAGHWGSPPQDYLFLYTFVAGLRPRYILEIGTHLGASAIVMAQAARDFSFPVMIHTIDNDKRGDRRQDAADRIKATGHTDRITQHAGTIDNWKGREGGWEKFDLAFIDGSHLYDDVRRDFDAVVGMGVEWILLHDSLATKGVKNFVYELTHGNEDGNPFNEIVTLPLSRAGITIIHANPTSPA